MIRAIIFDCFGVLRPDVLHAAYQKFGGDVAADKRFIHDTLFASHRGYIESSAPVFADRLGISTDAWLRAITVTSNDQQLLDYIVDLRKIYRVGVLSNVGKDGLLRYFSREEIARYFDVVVASGEVGYAKPQLESYQITAERLGVAPEECVFTDDNALYCESARQTGMQSIRYENFNQFRNELEALLADAK